MLWILIAALTVLVVAVLVWPLAHRSAPARSGRVDYDVVVYREQLAEIDSEIERGLMTPDEAAGARAEVHRRMLAAEDADLAASASPQVPIGRRWRIAVVALVVAVVPAGALAMYAQLGSPGLKGQPYAERSASSAAAPPHARSAATPEIEAQLAALAKSPSAAGYQKLAKLYYAAHDYRHAAAAERKCIELGDKNDPAAWSEYGETLVMASEGAVGPEAMLAFTRALSIEPKSERSRFYIGLAETQIGNLKEAVAVWRDLERDSPKDAPWLPMLREHIATFAKEGGFDPTSIAPHKPDAKSLEAKLEAMSKAMHRQSGVAAGKTAR